MKVIKIISEMIDCNNYLVCENGYCVLIEASITPQTLKKHLDKNKLVGIFLTHLHFDHIYYLEEILKEFQVPVYCSKLNKDKINEPHINGSYLMPELYFQPNINTNLLAGVTDEIIKLDNFIVNCITTPGHSNCCLCFKINNALFVGDTLFYTGIGRTDLLPNGKALMASSLQKLLTLSGYDVVYSGHGEQSSYAQQQKNIETFYKYITRKII